ncbi:hypothetical protein GCM10010109_92730 [Actinoplanes campanulatus]|nr:hypothetical protein GCM10010109_92730 [Actinoplanes campanulatus]GID42715.1 hypothetical protein Aca09nite_92210 [Actinoplanes campanulatus]
MDQWDVALGRISGQQREPDRSGIAIGAVPHQPPAGLPHTLPIRAQRRSNNVVVAMDGKVDIAEGIGKFTRLRVRLAEVPVEDDGDIGPVQSLIPRALG